ncbi:MULTISPECIES: hypothetical protein [unclassified Carboxylicivirga]|uniref:hypothetical protein n=1 Tax=Carboxylicivirga TaxID=1628153 RepID=UPI003D3446D4
MRFLVKGAVLLIIVLMTACDKGYEHDRYSSYGVDHDKSVLYDNVDALQSQLEALGKTPFATLCHSMSQRLDGKDVEGNARFVQAMMGLGNLMYNTAGEDCYFAALMDLVFDRGYYCTQLLADGYGQWQWNEELGQFEKVKDCDDKIVFIFPSADDATAADAVLTVSDLAFYGGVFPGKGEEQDSGQIVDQVLERLYCNIKVGSDLLLTSNLLSTFAEDGHFKDVALTFNAGSFNLNGELEKEDREGFWRWTFSNNSARILEHELCLRFNEHNTFMPVDDIENKLVLKNIMAKTRARSGAVYNELEKVMQLQEGSEEYATALAGTLNTHAIMDIRYLNYTILARVKPIARQQDDGSGTWYIDLEFEFSDGSRESGDIYFNNYLNYFKIELEKLVAEFENKFGVRSA